MGVDRMSPLDATFLHIEDSVSHMHIASVGIFEGPAPAFADIVAMIESKLSLVPRYRRVVRHVPLELGRPLWVDDPHFNIDYHLRHTALPSPGGEDELRKLVGRVMSQPLDRSKPLWEIWIVEGLEDGHWALLAKTHHAMVDGVSGTELLALMLDVSPDPVTPVAVDWRPESAPTGVQLAAQASLELLRSPYEQVRALRAAIRVPAQVLEQTREVVQGLSAMLGRSAGPRSRASTVRSVRIAGMRGPRLRSPTSRRFATSWAAHSTMSCWPPSPMGSASSCSPAASRWTAWCAPWSRFRCARATTEVARSGTERCRTRSRLCSPSSRCPSPMPPSVCKP